MFVGTRARAETTGGGRCGRRGSVILLVAISMVMMIAVAGIAIDVGMAYRQHANLQDACDAAALAAVLDMQISPAAAKQSALTYAGLNGFTDGVGACAVTVTPSPGGNTSQYQVTVTQPYITLFVRLVGATQISMTVQTTAQYSTAMPIAINGGATPGQDTSTITLSAFGPYSFHSYGDGYDTKWLDNGDLNPTYRPSGIDFSLAVPTAAAYFAKYGTYLLKVELFDPDCGNPGDAVDGIDEIRTVPPAPHQQMPLGMAAETVTRYQLFTPTDHPNDVSQDTPVATVQYGKDATVSGTWVNPPGFTVDLRSYLAGAGGNYRLNVATLAGSSENGYNLRAGPPGMSWVVSGSNKAATITANSIPIVATGVLPLNFNEAGTATIDFGSIPAAPIAYRVHVMKFDTDVNNGVSPIYKDDTGAINITGTLAGNDQYKEDIFTIPAGYPGGRLTCIYSATGSDTSSWGMSFEGASPGQPGRPKLVQ